MAEQLRAFVETLPKIDLHIHLLGTISATTAAELSDRNGLPAPLLTDGTVPSFPPIGDFDDFISLYSGLTNLVRSSDDLTLLTVEAAKAAARANTRYLEISVSPYSHLRRGMPAAEIADGLTRGRRAAAGVGVDIRWILGIPGEQRRPAKVADDTLRFAIETDLDGLVGIGVGGKEVGIPRAQFRPQFEAAARLGLGSAVHAGETSGADAVWSAVRDLGATRIGHALSAVSDPELLAYLRDRSIVVEVCPASNLLTGLVTSLENHPARTMLAAGIPITIGTDNPGIFGTSLTEEYLACARSFQLSRDCLYTICAAGIEAAFCDEGTKASLRRSLAAHRVSRSEQPSGQVLRSQVVHQSGH